MSCHANADTRQHSTQNKELTRKEVKRLTGSSAFNATALVPVLDGHDEVPLLVHRDRVGEQSVEDLDAEESGQVDVGEADEGVGGALADAVERGPGRGGEQLGQLEARVGVIDVDREWVVVELREQLSEGDEKKRQQLT